MNAVANERFVTSFSSDGYYQYGRYFLESYREHCDIPLVVYLEDPIEDDWMEKRSLYDVDGCKDFIDKTKHLNGYVEGKYEYSMNVNKFCRKVFAVSDFALGFDGNFAWIDADTIIKKDIEKGFIGDVLEDNYVACLLRQNCLPRHPECGFMAFNTENDVNNLFMSLYRSTYLGGAFQFLQTQCDSSVFHLVLMQLLPKTRNLTPVFDSPSENYRVSREPMKHSMLDEYIDHYKGRRKDVLHRRRA